MTTSRPRRIVSRAAMALAGVVLLVPVAHVSLWVAIPFAADRGIIGRQTEMLFGTICQPVESYAISNKPGAWLLRDLWEKVNGPMFRAS